MSIVVGIYLATAVSQGRQSIAFSGLVFSIVQFPPLRRNLQHPWRWIPLSLVGWLVSVPLAFVLGFAVLLVEGALRDYGQELPYGSLGQPAGAAMTGLLLGLFQTGAIGFRRPGVGWWPIVNMIGGALIGLGLLLFVHVNVISQGGFIPLLAVALLYGLLTAPVILHLTAQQRPVTR
jgi:hypothetical protein